MAYLELRPVEISDAERTFELIASNREHLGRWFPWVENTKSVSDREDYILSLIEERCVKECEDYAILHENTIVGVIGFTINSKKTASIGYWLGGEHQGKGLATISCKKVIRILFEDYKVHRIEIRAAVENMNSRKVAERAGFKLEGILRDVDYRDGEYESEAVYSILENEYILL